jgi:hypothetical protein
MRKVTCATPWTWPSPTSSGRNSWPRMGAGLSTASSLTIWGRCPSPAPVAPPRRERGQKSKPESYYFPRQLNNHGGRFPFRSLAWSPAPRRSRSRNACATGTRATTRSSTSPRLQAGARHRWDVPAGVLHARVACAPTSPGGQ